MKWTVQDDIKTVDNEGKVTYTRGPEYEIEMSDSDKSIYRGAGILALLVSIAIILAIGGMIVA